MGHNVRMRLLLLAVVLAAPGSPDRRLRHEWFPPSVLTGARPTEAPSIEGGEPLPDAVRRDGERLPRPGARDPDDPQFGADGQRQPPAGTGPTIPRPSAFQPDRRTTPDAPLTYHAVFNPSVAPLRRDVVLNTVDARYELQLSPGPLVEVPLAPREPIPGRELFWADLEIEAGAAGEAVPIPSVAPDMRPLAIDVRPPAAVAVVKDRADNFYLRPDRAGARRIVMLVDADSAYFSGAVAGTVPVESLASDPDARLPGRARAAARDVLQALGVSAGMPFTAGLDQLVAHFRAFEAGPPPKASDDIYADLALGRVGVCRHRAFAFTITARAAGIPTRMVVNEAHAFVEIRAPDGRWRRVDLGGQAPEVDLKGGQNRRMHSPPPDAFPKPESYLDDYSAQLLGAGRGRGPGASDISGAPPPVGGRDDPADDLPGPGGDGADGAGGVGSLAQADPEAVPLPNPEAPPGPGSGLDAGLFDGVGGAVAADAPPPPRPVRVVLDEDLGTGVVDVFRGDNLPFRVAGVVMAADDGEPARGVEVQLYLLPAGTGAPIAAGTPARTGDDGIFRFEGRVPPSLPLGRYRVAVASRAENGWAAGRTD
jgi:hypothetical protein